METPGVTTIAAAFAKARRKGRTALVAYLTAGYPTPADTVPLARALVQGGADLVELGVPFSDPVADGPIIQAAGQRALERGVTPSMCVHMVRRAREAGLRVPLLLMGYCNPILSYGVEPFVRDCASAGVDGLIVPDLPPEEAVELEEACSRKGLALVYLVAPTTGEERLAAIARRTSGFLYVVPRLGITGAETRPEEAILRRLALVRRYARTPVAVGFGIRRPEQAAALAGHADGVIVGSAFVERAADGPAAVRTLAEELSAALDERRASTGSPT